MQGTRWWLVASVACGGIAVGSSRPAPVAAQAPDPRIEVWLYASYVGIQTASTGRPTVRLFDADGNRRAEVTATGQPAGGRWQVPLSPNAGLIEQTLVKPGDRIQVALDGRVTTVIAPDMRAEADVEVDTLSGTAPPGTVGVYALVHRDETWFDPPHNADAIGPATPRPDGRFDIDLAAAFDIAPGTWGEAVAVGADGHFTIAPFAPPSIIIATTEPIAILRAGPATRPILTTQSAIGTELFRSAPAYALGGSLFAVLLVQDGIPENGIYVPGPDETVVMLSGGRPVLEAPLPRVLATIDPVAAAVAGYAPAGARTVVELDPTGRSGATRTMVLTPGADGRFSAAFPGQAIADGATATVQTYGGRGVASETKAAVPRQTVLLYGYALTGTIPGWDDATVEQRGPDGTLKARAETTADATGAFEARLVTPAGDHAAIRPGDRLVVSPALGGGVDIAIPPLTVEVDSDRRAMNGSAPANVEVTAAVYSQDPDFFGQYPYDRPYIKLAGRSDAGGRYTIQCVGAECAMRYGLVTTRVGSTDFVLQWLDTPFVGVGVTVSGALGRATAGLPITVTPFLPDGRPGTPILDIVRPGLGGGLPGLEIPLGERFPDGLHAGDRVRIEIGGSAYDVVAPAFDWHVRPATDTVSGTGPALRTLLLIAVARGDTANRPDYGTATTAIGANRQWQARFAGFDLRNGDDLEIYLLNDNHFLWWTDVGLAGADPDPTATPTLPPSATPTPYWPIRRPTVFLPYGGRG